MAHEQKRDRRSCWSVAHHVLEVLPMLGSDPLPIRLEADLPFFRPSKNCEFVIMYACYLWSGPRQVRTNAEHIKALGP